MEAGCCGCRIRQVMTSPETQAPASFSLGIVLLAVSAFFVTFVGQIAARGVGKNADPGPRLFPLVAAGCLAAGGLGELVRVRRSRLSTGAGTEFDREPAGRRPIIEVVVLMVLVVGYVSAIPWTGFPLTTLVFSAVLMIRQRTRWWHAIFLSALLVAATYLVFVRLFSVPLPEGELWMG